MKTKTAQFIQQIIEEYVDLQAINQAGAIQIEHLQAELETKDREIAELKMNVAGLEDAAESAWREVQSARNNDNGYADKKRRAQEIKGMEVSDG